MKILTADSFTEKNSQCRCLAEISEINSILIVMIMYELLSYIVTEEGITQPPGTELERR